MGEIREKRESAQPTAIFDESTVQIMIQTRNLLDELLETLDIMSNPESMIKIVQAEKDVEEGRVRGFDEFLDELKEKDEI